MIDEAPGGTFTDAPAWFRRCPASARFQGLAGEDVVGDVVVGGALGVHHEDFHLFPVLGEHHPGLVAVGSVEGVVDQDDA